MTQKEANILVEIITKVVRKELTSFKKQLLSEINGTPVSSPSRNVEQPARSTDKLTEVHKNFRKTFQSPQTPQNRKRLSSDPVLNSILSECEPIPDEAVRMNDAIMEADINLPTSEYGGLMSTNANVDHVLEAMNRDYSGMFKPKNQGSPTTPVQPSPPAQSIRSKYAAIMDEAEPFEEDMSWLNEVQ